MRKETGEQIMAAYPEMASSIYRVYREHWGDRPVKNRYSASGIEFFLADILGQHHDFRKQYIKGRVCIDSYSEWRGTVYHICTRIVDGEVA